VSVAIAAAMVEVLSGSVAGAASDVAALDTVLRTGAVLAFAGAIVLLAFGRLPQHPQTTESAKVLEAP
jgi:hypothetical protein